MLLARFSSVLLAALALAPFVVVARGASELVEPLSRTVAEVLLGITAPLAAPAPPAAVAAAAPPGVVAPPPVVAAPPTAQSRRGGARPPAPARPQALFVSQQTVLKLAESAARPRGAFVPQTTEHPAGLLLAGVSALGIGVQDGDILIEALGIAPRGPGEIIGAVVQARAKNARFLTGTLWRRGETFRITVEQPYLPAAG